MSVWTGKVYRHLRQAPFHSPSGCMVRRSIMNPLVLQIAQRTPLSLDSTCSTEIVAIPRSSFRARCQTRQYSDPGALLQLPWMPKVSSGISGQLDGGWRGLPVVQRTQGRFDGLQTFGIMEAYARYYRLFVSWEHRRCEKAAASHRGSA